MELKTSNIYVVIDKEFNAYDSNSVIIGAFDIEEEAKKLNEDLNIKHYLELEAKVNSTDIVSRYSVMSVQEAINFVIHKMSNEKS